MIEIYWLNMFTPPKTNMEAENGPLQKEIPLGNYPFQGSMLVFRGVLEIILWDHVASPQIDLY